jgi:hypothetical protein
MTRRGLAAVLGDVEFGAQERPGDGVVSHELVEARKRARDLLVALKYYDGGRAAPGASVSDVRALARIALDLADLVDAEHSARAAATAQRDEARRVVSRQARELAEALMGVVRDV